MDHRDTSIVAVLDLTNDMQRRLHDLLLRMHTGRRSLFARMHDIRREGSALVELAKWRRGGFAVVRWAWTANTIGLTWQDCPTLATARQAFLKSAPQ